jgi:hypothetical protein
LVPGLAVLPADHVDRVLEASDVLETEVDVKKQAAKSSQSRISGRDTPLIVIEVKTTHRPRA